jgi:DNA-binding GntR family transcriptional regulator
LASELKTARRPQPRPAAPLRTVVLQTGAGARSQGERAYLLIRDQIVTLKLSPGAVIEEARLREDLGLGRTPIREALQRLAHENLVTFVPHRGTFVSEINITDLARLTEIRAELEGYAARLAAERAAPEEREAMAYLEQELKAVSAEQPEPVIHLDQRIHRLVYQASHNRFLEEVCERYFNLSLRLWFLVLKRVNLGEALDGLKETLGAIAGRDASRAEAALRRHVIAFEQEVRRVL